MHVLILSRCFGYGNDTNTPSLHVLLLAYSLCCFLLFDTFHTLNPITFVLYSSSIQNSLQDQTLVHYRSHQTIGLLVYGRRLSERYQHHNVTPFKHYHYILISLRIGWTMIQSLSMRAYSIFVCLYSTFSFLTIYWDLVQLHFVALSFNLANNLSFTVVLVHWNCLSLHCNTGSMYFLHLVSNTNPRRILYSYRDSLRNLYSVPLRPYALLLSLFGTLLLGHELITSANYIVQRLAPLFLGSNMRSQSSWNYYLSPLCAPLGRFHPLLEQLLSLFLLDSDMLYHSQIHFSRFQYVSCGCC